MKTVAGVFKAFNKMKADLDKIGEKMMQGITKNTVQIIDLENDNVAKEAELEAAQKGIERINKFLG